MSEKAQADKQSVEQARLYVQAFRAFDLIVTEEATRTQWSFRDEDGKKTSRTYSDYLGLTMASFTIWEGPPSIPATQLELKKAAIAFVAAVDRGLMNGDVKQGQG